MQLPFCPSRLLCLWISALSCMQGIDAGGQLVVEQKPIELLESVVRATAGLPAALGDVLDLAACILVIM